MVMALSHVFPWTAGEGIPQLVDWPNLGEPVPRVVVCPHCGHHVTLFIDAAGGSGHQDLVEDCPLCCRPVELHVDMRDFLVEDCTAEKLD
jgi:endogenous inhibitor of DNA gyrase (YacG/DUF329 family)